MNFSIIQLFLRTALGKKQHPFFSKKEGKIKRIPRILKKRWVWIVYCFVVVLVPCWRPPPPRAQVVAKRKGCCSFSGFTFSVLIDVYLNQPVVCPSEGRHIKDSRSPADLRAPLKHSSAPFAKVISFAF